MARRKYSHYGFYYEPTRPIEVDDGIKARSQRGAFAKHWWAKQWIDALERLVDPGRLSRGRNYARRGQVLSVEEIAGGVEARVQGSRRRPYKVSILVAPLSAAQWDQVLDALAEQALFTAQLLSGEMPQDIEQAFQSAGVSLLPGRAGDLTTACSCPDWANPCKHVAAAHYILGERFDEDPFLLFRLRGRTQEQILASLRQRRAEEADLADEEDGETALPLEGMLEQYYELGAPLEGFSVAIRDTTLQMPLLLRLGEAAFVPTPGILALLGPAYQEIAQAALGSAFQELTGEENGSQ